MDTLLERLAERSSRLAVELTLAGAPVVVVGSTARRLLGEEALCPRDLDVAVADHDLPALVDALSGLGIRASEVGVRRAGVWTTPTQWCPLDVFVVPIRPAPVRVLVEGIAVALDAQ